MPTIDQNAVITQLLVDIKNSLAALPAAVAAAVSAKLPAPSVTPPTPDPEAEAKAFLAKYTPQTPAEFKAQYGVNFGQNIPALAAPIDPVFVIGYARNGYSWQGFHKTGPPDLQTIMDDIAHGRVNWNTGNGLVDSDILAVGFKTEILVNEATAQASFGSGSSSWPSYYVGWDFQTFCKTLHGGTPSGG